MLKLEYRGHEIKLSEGTGFFKFVDHLQSYSVKSSRMIFKATAHGVGTVFANNGEQAYNDLCDTIDKFELAKALKALAS